MRYLSVLERFNYLALYDRLKRRLRPQKKVRRQLSIEAIPNFLQLSQLSFAPRTTSYAQQHTSCIHTGYRTVRSPVLSFSLKPEICPIKFHLKKKTLRFKYGARLLRLIIINKITLDRLLDFHHHHHRHSAALSLRKITRKNKCVVCLLFFHVLFFFVFVLAFFFSLLFATCFILFGSTFGVLFTKVCAYYSPL